MITSPYYNIWNQDLEVKPDLSLVKEDTINEYLFEMPVFVYKKSQTQTTVFANPGYKTTLVMETEYQYCIEDIYTSVLYYYNGISFHAIVRTYGNKDEITFEQLEGRRYYFRPLIDKIISTAKIDDDYKVCKTKKIPERK